MIDKNNIVLDFPSMAVFPSYVEALREGYRQGIRPAASDAEIKSYENDPNTYLLSLNEDKTGEKFTAPTGEEFPYVPYEILWLFHDTIFIGGVSFRFKLSNFLENFGGHIGYGIRPLYQGRGYGTLALSLTKIRAAQKDMDKLLLTCSPDNIASQRIIIKNGGVYQDTLPDPYGYGPTMRYWVPTT